MTTVHDQSIRTGQEKALSVAELLRAAGDGNPLAWEEIVRRYLALVWAKVRSFRLQHADACDAAQVTWLRLAENCHRIRNPEHLGGWLVTTAHRECLRILRRPTHLSYADEAMVNPTDPAAGPEQRIIDADTAQALDIFLNELPPRQRALLQELFTNPQSYTEVAHTPPEPRGAV